MKNLYKITSEYILSRTAYKILFIISTMLIAVPYIREKIGAISGVMLVYGFIIVAYELITGKLLSALRSTKTVWLLGGFALSYIITILINKTHIYGGFRSLSFMVLMFVLCFLFPQDTTKEKILKEIKLVSATIIACTFTYSFASFFMYVFSISGKYFTANGDYEAYYGMFDSRLWGLYNPNTGATLTILSVLLSIAFLIINKRKRVRIPLLVNIFIQFSVMLLTGSRAGYYVLAGVIAFCTFFTIAYKMQNFTIKTASLSIVSAALSLGLFFAVGAVLREGLAYLPGVTEYILSENDNTTENENGEGEDTITKIDLNRSDLLETEEQGAFANRLDIWEASFEEFLEAPIFGVGRENLVERAADKFENKQWLYFFKYGSTHNVYLCVLVSSGIIGFLLLGSFAAITVIRSSKTLVKTYKKVGVWFLMSFVLCLMMYATEFVETRILYKISIFGVVFWIYCGYMYKLSKIERIEKSEQLTPNNND